MPPTPSVCRWSWSTVRRCPTAYAPYRRWPRPRRGSERSDPIQTAEVANGLAATLQHHHHHVVPAFGRAGERAPEHRQQRHLQHAETVITPTGFAIVAGDAEAKQLVVVGVD